MLIAVTFSASSYTHTRELLVETLPAMDFVMLTATPLPAIRDRDPPGSIMSVEIKHLLLGKAVRHPGHLISVVGCTPYSCKSYVANWIFHNVDVDDLTLILQGRLVLRAENGLHPTNVIGNFELTCRNQRRWL